MIPISHRIILKQKLQPKSIIKIIKNQVTQVAIQVNHQVIVALEVHPQEAQAEANLLQVEADLLQVEVVHIQVVVVVQEVHPQEAQVEVIQTNTLLDNEQANYKPNLH